jgi:hypothetical protein
VPRSRYDSNVRVILAILAMDIQLSPNSSLLELIFSTTIKSFVLQRPIAMTRLSDLDFVVESVRTDNSITPRDLCAPYSSFTLPQSPIRNLTPSQRFRHKSSSLPSLTLAMGFLVKKTTSQQLLVMSVLDAVVDSLSNIIHSTTFPYPSQAVPDSDSDQGIHLHFLSSISFTIRRSFEQARQTHNFGVLAVGSILTFVVRSRRFCLMCLYSLNFVVLHTMPMAILGIAQKPSQDASLCYFSLSPLHVRRLYSQMKCFTLKGADIFFSIKAADTSP